MSRRRMAGDADYNGRLNAVGSAILDELKGTDRYSKYREIDEVFPEKVTIDNAENVLLSLAPRTQVNIDDSGNVTGGDAIVDNKGRVNLDKIPYNNDELSRTAPDAVNSTLDPQMQAFLYPDDVNSPALHRAASIGKAMRANDPAAYRKAGMPIEADDDAIAYLASKFTKGKNNTPLRSTSFAKVGGLGTEGRSQILIPGTNTRFVDLSKEQQSAYMDQRVHDLIGQFIRQGGGSIGNPSAAIVPPGMNSHMDHVRALSSSKDSIGDTGWGYSDAVDNFSWLDAESNVHSKLNYSLQGQHMMMQLADQMRQKNQPFPARLSQSQLGDPNRKRLTDEEGAIRLATDKATNVNDAGENLLAVIQYLNKYGPSEMEMQF